MTDRNRKLLINTALILHKEKLEKKLKKEKEKFDKLCEIKLPARQGIRGGMNTKITSRIETSSESMRTLKEQIKVLDEEIKKNKGE